MIRKPDRFLSSLCLATTLTAAVSGSLAAADVLELVEPCTACHGKDGASTEPDIPIIGGYSAFYMEDSMAAFREKERPCEETEIRAGPRKGELTDMCEVAAKLSEADIERIAEYFASRPFVRAKQDFDPDKAKRGAVVHGVQCRKCHEEGGSSPDDDAGILAGQWMPYIEHQFREFASGERPMPKKMKPKFEKLSETDREDLLHYFASFQ
jgi:sulfide dehydrogenase cytochrome subunit